MNKGHQEAKQKMSAISGEHRLDCPTRKPQAWEQRILTPTRIHFPILLSRMASNFPVGRTWGNFLAVLERNSFYCQEIVQQIGKHDIHWSHLLFLSRIEVDHSGNCLEMKDH